MAPRKTRSSKRPHKIGLVLAGGGIIGGVYQIGVLKALNDVLKGFSVNDFDLYVGTSCGAFIGSCLANRITPEEMMASLAGEEVEGFRFHRADILKFNVGETAEKLARLPLELTRFWLRTLWRMRPIPPMDAFYQLVKGLPNGIYDSRAIDRLLTRIFEAPRTNRFDELGRELYVTATDLESSALRVFCHDDAEVPISRAVAASAAIPIVYRPVRIQGRDYVDGGMDDTMHAELAIERGAKLLICVNPLVPYSKDGTEAGHHVLDLGFPFIGKQVVRTILSTRVRYDLRLIKRRYPDVDVIHFQPSESDFKMFYNPIMKYASRVEIAVHGFENAARILARDFEQHRETLARHGIDASLDGVAGEIEAIEALGPRSRGAASILEGVARQYRMTPTPKGPLAPLSHALHDLDVALDRQDRLKAKKVEARKKKPRSAASRSTRKAKPSRRPAAKKAARSRASA